MRTLVSLFVLVSSLASASLAADAESPGSWLGIEAVDHRARQPFNPDSIFLRYLLDRASPPPREGEEVTGARTRAWKRLEPDEKGRVGGVAYAYAEFESAVKRVVIARVRGGATLFLNGTGYVGDVYGYRHSGVPVLVRKGTNRVFVRGIRGAFRLEFEALDGAGAVRFAERDATVPHLVAGRPVDTVFGLVVYNATNAPVDRLVLRCGEWKAVYPGGLAPLGVRKLWVPVTGPAAPEAGGRVPFAVSLGDASRTVELEVREPLAPRRITHVSPVDGSAQEFSVLPPTGTGAGAAPGIVLTLHGAGVDAFGQVRAYSPKPDLWIVAPTNRRPFGFDWQDWGRRDAYEVLVLARALAGADPARTYLTGHSMGGHGVWHLAANDPDAWAAIAPSAGWCSFDTYAGGRPDTSLSEVWKGADGASRTLGLIDNLAQLPVFILHGEKDDNVPLQEARRMEQALRDAGAEPAIHVQPGAGHWWNGKAAEGTDCVDWPGIFEHFAAHRRARNPVVVDFTGADPGVDARHHWIEVGQPLRYGRFFRVRARRGPRGVHVVTDNVRRMRLALPGRRLHAVIDGQVVDAPGRSWLLHSAFGWFVEPYPEGEKRPARSGPFKRAFDRNFVFVVGASDAEGLARARFDAEQWWYRANGDVAVLTDERFLAGGFADRNVILYGNRDANRAFDAVLDDDCPLTVRSGHITLGDRRLAGENLACAYVYPRRGDPDGLVGVLGYTGARGARLGYGLLPFTSGVGYPDYAVFSDAYLSGGDAGVLAAGWFSHDWSLDEGAGSASASAGR